MRGQVASASQNLRNRNLPVRQVSDGLRRDLEAVGLRIFPFTAEDADTAANIRDPSRELSLSCRACLALASRLKLPIMTADQTWKQIDAGIDIQLIR